MRISINFLKYKYFGWVLSFLLITVGVITYFVKGGFNYNIDFAGGAEIRVAFQKPIDIGILRKALSGEGWEGSEIQSIGNSGKSYIVRVGVEKVESVQNLEKDFEKTIDKATPGNTMTVDNIEMVGAQVGKDIQWAAIKAVLLSLLILLFYIGLRYKFAYAAGAVAALLHDILAVLVMILLLGEPISLSILAAILAMLGYSLNDTIVIFSRIRSNLKTMKGASKEKIINTSLNQTFKRTMLTSFTTLLVVGAVFILGGETLRGFSKVMLMGIIFGTYSSIYIASLVLLALMPSSSNKEK